MVGHEVNPCGEASATSESTGRKPRQRGLGRVRKSITVEGPGGTYLRDPLFGSSRTRTRAVGAQGRKMKREKASAPQKVEPSIGVGDGGHGQAELKEQKQIDGGARRVGAAMQLANWVEPLDRQRQGGWYYHVKSWRMVAFAKCATTVRTIPGPGEQHATDLKASLWRGPPRSFFYLAASPRSGRRARTSPGSHDDANRSNGGLRSGPAPVPL